MRRQTLVGTAVGSTQRDVGKGTLTMGDPKSRVKGQTLRAVSGEADWERAPNCSSMDESYTKPPSSSMVRCATLCSKNGALNPLNRSRGMLAVCVKGVPGRGRWVRAGAGRGGGPATVGATQPQSTAARQRRSHPPG